MKYLSTIAFLAFVYLSCSKNHYTEKPAAEIATIDSVKVHKVASLQIAVDVDITVKDPSSLTSIELYSSGYMVGKITKPGTGHYTITGASWPSPVKAPYNFTLITSWGRYELSTFYLEY